jgi:hypothetical protein
MRFPIAFFIAAIALPVAAQQHDPSMHQRHMASPAPTTNAPATDARQAVSFPKALRDHTLSNMRDHLLALQEIQSALSNQQYERAAEVAETRLGMSSLNMHGAQDVAKYMPKGMQDAGTAMHRNASRFAVAARDATATGDLKPPLAMLSDVMGACVACHSGYRLE